MSWISCPRWMNTFLSSPQRTKEQLCMSLHPEVVTTGMRSVSVSQICHTLVTLTWVACEIPNIHTSHIFTLEGRARFLSVPLASFSISFFLSACLPDFFVSCLFFPGERTQNWKVYYSRIKILGSCLFLQPVPANLNANRLDIKQ